MNSVIFVCLGNICRSPIAEGVAKKIAGEKALHVRVASAVTSHWHVGEKPVPKLRKSRKEKQDRHLLSQSIADNKKRAQRVRVCHRSG